MRPCPGTEIAPHQGSSGELVRRASRSLRADITAYAQRFSRRGLVLWIRLQLGCSEPMADLVFVGLLRVQAILPDGYGWFRLTGK